MPGTENVTVDGIVAAIVATIIAFSTKQELHNVCDLLTEEAPEAWIAG